LPPSIAGHLPGQISGGEAQRVSLARALLFRPRLLIMDEATSMLDVSTQANVVGLVKELMQGNGGSVLFISHDMELLKASCGRIYTMENGRLNV
jgi:ABC-type dipeptide/oligopeptide/nickel transport system ATPase subunit